MIILTACTPKTEQEKQKERYEAAFHEYVATDSDDPSSLIEVTNIEVNDTTMPPMELVTVMDDLVVKMRMMKLKQRLDDISARLKKEKGLVFFEVKARVIMNKQPRVLTYYGYENLTDRSIKISNEKISAHDPLLPSVYKDVVNYTEDLNNTIDL